MTVSGNQSLSYLWAQVPAIVDLINVIVIRLRYFRVHSLFDILPRGSPSLLFRIRGVVVAESVSAPMFVFKYIRSSLAQLAVSILLHLSLHFAQDCLMLRHLWRRVFDLGGVELEV